MPDGGTHLSSADRLSLSVVVPCFNGARTILTTLRCLLEQTSENTELIVIDDLSTDGTVHLVRSNYPAIRIHENAANIGAAAARNLGWVLTQGDVILFVDADVALQAGCLDRLLEGVRSADIVFPLIRYPNGMRMYPIGEGQSHYPLISPAFLIKRASLKGIPGTPFDEEYRTYCEDTDFFLRAYLAGLTARYVPEASAIHDVDPHQRDREGRYYLEVKNSIYGAIKFAGNPEIRRLDHAFKLYNIIKVVMCGFFNFNLFDMQARGHHKHHGLAYEAGLLLRGQDKLSNRGSCFLVPLALRAILWNFRHISRPLAARKLVRPRPSRHR